MRILWSSNAPWVKSGYGRMTALVTPMLQAAGHEVAIAAFHGLQGEPATWRNLPVYPAGLEPWGLDTLPGHYKHWDADILITLQDFWTLDARQLSASGMRIAAWLPVDCTPLGVMDSTALRVSSAVPIAMSQHGVRELEAAGWCAAPYVPHAVDCSLFSPVGHGERSALRAEMGLEGKFVVGVNAANQDHNRKGFVEQMRGFSAFARRHADAVLLLNTVAGNEMQQGLNLMKVAEACGITDKVFFSSQYESRAGLVSDSALVRWYNALDVLSNCSWGEGFGLPILEAQACGTPVIVTKGSAMTELCGAGWLVEGDPFWNARHSAWWVRPFIGGITRAYEKAYAGAAKRRGAAREFGLGYEAEHIFESRWQPCLESTGLSSGGRKACTWPAGTTSDRPSSSAIFAVPGAGNAKAPSD